MPSCPPRPTLFPYTTLFRSDAARALVFGKQEFVHASRADGTIERDLRAAQRSEEHTSELQSLRHLVCRLAHRDLHSFPTRRSSDLMRRARLFSENRNSSMRAAPMARSSAISARHSSVWRKGRSFRKSDRKSVG